MSSRTDPHPKWALYGLLENREHDHDLRFLCLTDERPFEAAQPYLGEYEAVVAFDADSRKQVDREDEIVSGAAAVAMLGMGWPCRWAGEVA